VCHRIGSIVLLISRAQETPNNHPAAHRPLLLPGPSRCACSACSASQPCCCWTWSARAMSGSSARWGHEGSCAAAPGIPGWARTQHASSNTGLLPHNPPPCMATWSEPVDQHLPLSLCARAIKVVDIKAKTMLIKIQSGAQAQHAGLHHHR